MKHTPGPWEAVWNGYYYDIAALTSEPGKANIASVHENEFYPETTGKAEANARLIAAAPDMLEALENIENDDAHMPATVWDLIQKAIAKAKGESR